MSVSVDKSFIKHFQADVHLAYQQYGSRLRPTVRSKGGIRGSSTVFQKVGKGTASTKARHGMVPVMNMDHTPVECILQDYYAGDWVDRLDELKTSLDERAVLVKAGAGALGRKTDELILAEMAKATVSALDGTTGMTREKALAAFEQLGNADVPDDGERFVIVGWKQWSELLKISEFARSDYIGPDALPWQGTQAKRWLGSLWMPHTGLPLSEGKVRSCFWYHRTAVGHAVGSDVVTDISWHGDRAAHFVNNMMSQGAALIDTRGIVSMPCLET
ncbi:hypothetical protein HEQ62_04000 [Haematospirillum jordaniae]|uniref:Capsid protein n=1 Tax=Haematospirillum jordaniae TaxID=1549855 RepID=A0A143DDD3_9PROT|nr:MULTISPECIES: phage capsid protein [Haematospirillum]AMW34744.1 hypothetical protein AY555_05615 [Haematospirillum jordaniae]NKD45516.1 hypothetical protein [Haematospirillum jordaniae]NKD56901.1 hypothetical protein [Haematospirillum jordaniae]NKD58943.1 hypothetical protein [Haematospirillum jordaniae]NKD66826.1 hypothetical protein [Haematospirillum jordaniae]